MPYLSLRKGNYNNHCGSARQRGLKMLLSYQEWYCWWMSTGKAHLRGCTKESYVMARLNDEGDYTLDNIKCIPHSKNLKESYSNGCHDEENRLKSLRMKGKTIQPRGYKHSKETKEKIGEQSAGRKHSDDTKEIISIKLLGNQNARKF